MIDIYTNYRLQREELLARIAQELQLDKTRLARMESAYETVAGILKEDKDFYEGLTVEVYAQGSKRIGTTVKPINDEDFDLDIVLHLYDPYYKHTPSELYNNLASALERNQNYKSILERKTRCVRLNYKSDFHMDILPACMPHGSEMQEIKIPERELRTWSSGNPKGFAEWFLQIANSVRDPLLKLYSDALLEARVETEPLPEDLYLKTPLQRAVQLLKRYRDIYFKDKDYKVSSIVITTLAASFYRGENSIFDTIDNIINRIKENYTELRTKGHRFRILNPVNHDEDFTDSWDEDHFISFFNFIIDIEKKWHNLKNSFETSKDDYIKLFGEGVYKKTLNEQFRTFSKASRNDLDKATGLIINGKAFTNEQGYINESTGRKNESHRNFGG